jgi:hypothetical protein
MLNRAANSLATPAPSPVKPPECCPHCGSRKITTRGRRLKKLETIRLYQCGACNRRFTPGPTALRHKTYPVGQILEALSEYNRGHSLDGVVFAPSPFRRPASTRPMSQERAIA